MVDEPDIWRAGNLLLREHGGDAPLVAAQRADKLLARGDVEGQVVWKRILKAVEQLQRIERRENEREN